MGCGSASAVSEKPNEREEEEKEDEEEKKEEKKEEEKSKKKSSKKSSKKPSKKSESKKSSKKKSESKKSKKTSKKSSEKKSKTESSYSQKHPIKTRKMGKKNYRLTEQDKEDELKQDLKEVAKRQGRLVKFSPLKKELEFEHKPEEEDIDLNLKPFSVGYEEEIHNGLNYGKPIRLFNQIWLNVDLPVEPDLYSPQVQVPPGWRIPTLDDYNELINCCGDTDNAEILLTHKKLLNMNKSFQYITKNRVFPDIFDGHDKRAWKYYCIAFDFEDKEEKKEKMEEDKDFNKKTKKQFVDDSIVSEYKDNQDDNVQQLEVKKKKGIKKSELIIPDEKEAEMIFELNPYSIFLKNTEEEKKENKLDEQIKEENDDKNNRKKIEDLYKLFKKNVKSAKNKLNPQLIFDVNTFKFKKTLHCKLISDNNYVPSLLFKCPLVIEAGYRAFFEVPFIYNITTFEWVFNDKYAKERCQTSDKFISCHIFNKPGEYKVDLYIRLFEFREYHLIRKVWVIPEIIHYESQIINGINYGQPIKIGNQIWLDRDIPNYINYKGNVINLKRGRGPGVHGENSFTESVCACPNGWRLPKKEEIELLLKFCGRNNEQRLFFFTLLEGGFLAEVNESGSYYLITLNFRLPSNQENYYSLDKKKMLGSAYANENHDKLIVKDDEEAFENDPIFSGNSDRDFDNKLRKFLRDYGNVILNTSNIGEIFDKEVYSLNIENNKVYLGYRTTSLNSPYSFFSTRFVLDETLELDLGLKDTSFPAEFEIQFEIDYSNVTATEWNFGDNTPLIKNKNKLKHAYKKPNVYEITVVVTLFEKYKYVIKKSLNIYSKTNLDSEETELNSKDQIFILQLGDLFKVKGVNNIHFSRSVAPIAPLMYENGFYIAFNNKLENKLLLFRIFIDSKSKSMREYFNQPLYQEESSLPLDICCTPYGCCMLLSDSRDEDLLFIEMISHEGELLWRNNIMQNGAYPIEAKINQLIFYNDKTKKPEFGMNAMFHPYSGRLCYGARRILCIFSYMNNFGVRVGGGREDNSGDLIITYSDDGTEVNLVSNWSTTHSLTQRTHFDGRYFYTAALGDAHPSNIKVLRIDPMLKIDINAKNKQNRINSYEKNDEFGENFGQIEQPEQKLEHYPPLQEKLINEAEKENNKIKTEFGYEESYYMRNLDYCGASNRVTLRHNFIYSEIVDGSIPGNLMGLTSGRLGNMTPIQNDKIAIVYSRTRCIDGGCMNKNSELSLIIFNSDLKVENVCHYRDGDLINCIKQARYGNNLLIMISLTKKITQDHKYIYDKFTFMDEPIDEEHLPCNFFLVNPGGKIKSTLISYYCNFFSPGDDFETLLDGSVVWSIVDDEDNLYLGILPVKDTQILLDRFPKEIIPCSKLDEFLSMRGEEAEKGRIEREKELMKKMGIDEEEIRKKILESEKLAREQREKEIEEYNNFYKDNEEQLNNNTENNEDVVNQLSENENNKEEEKENEERPQNNEDGKEEEITTNLEEKKIKIIKAKKKKNESDSQKSRSENKEDNNTEKHSKKSKINKTEEENKDIKEEKKENKKTDTKEDKEDKENKENKKDKEDKEEEESNDEEEEEDDEGEEEEKG